MTQTKITRNNFIIRLLSILSNIKNISKDSYFRFLNRAVFLKENEKNILKHINPETLNTQDLKRLQSLLSKLNEFNYPVIEKKIFLIFDKNENDFFNVLKSYTIYFKRKIEKKYNKLRKEEEKINNLHNSKHILKTNLIKKIPTQINEINIYIDEVWPDSVNPENSNTLNSMNIGAISGLIYLGKHDYKKLPKIETHIREEGNNEKERYKIFIDKLKPLLKNKNAIPFFMPVELPEGLNAQRYYFELLQISLKIIIGWVLPKTKHFIKINVYCEHFSTYEDDLDKTEFFDGIFESLTLVTNRFSNIIIQKVIWKDKEFQYIPYADLIGYIGLQHVHLNKELAKTIKLNTWNTFIPISLDTYNQLEKLDRFQGDNDIENIFDLLISLKGSKLGDSVFNLLKTKFEKNERFKNKTIATIEKYYMKKTRNISELRLIYTYFKKLVKNIKLTELIYKTQINIILIELQHINHEGSAQKGAELFYRYKEIRNKALKDNRELILYTDLNFIVHFNDLFKFEESLNQIKATINSFDFSFHTYLNKAKALSTYGQSLALNERYQEANNKFSIAIDYFKEADILETERQKEIEKTHIYKIINLINIKNPNAVNEFRALLQENDITVAEIAQTQNPRWNYIHYTLVKLLYNFDIPEKKEYLNNISEFYSEYHPFEVIFLYKALLSLQKKQNKEKALKYFNISIETINRKEHGTTIKLIGSIISLIALIYFPKNEYFKKKFKEYTNLVEKNLPHIRNKTKSIKKYYMRAKESDIKEILKILPFNYI